MAIYILRRVLWTIPVLFVATFFTFALMKMLPGNPFDFNPHISATVRINLERIYGLDRPWYEQYGRYVWHLLHGDFGPSTHANTGQRVGTIIADSLPTSMQLGSLAFLFALVIGVPLGVVSALKANTAVDYVITLFSTLAFAIPGFVTASYWVAYLTLYSGWDSWWERTGPITVLGLTLMPSFVRLVRASMLETMQQDFVLTAQAKGIPWRITVMRHMLRNSLIPVVTNAGPMFGFIITGAFIIEYIMDVHGIAFAFVASFRQPHDLNMVLGTTVMLSVVIVMMNLIVDVIIGYLDPRISHD